jgi:general nucleoside transport system permease protein
MQTLNNLIGPGIELSAPLILAAVGGLISYRAGIFNIALEGFMLFAAYFAVKAAAVTGSILLGVFAGVAFATALSAVMGVAVLWFRADEVIVGIALNLFALGLTSFLLNSGGAAGTGFLRLNNGLPEVHIGALNHVAVVNDVINGHDPLVFAAWVSVPLVAVLLRRTLFGLQLRAAGESPLAARAAGVRVDATKFASFLLSGVFSGLAGAQLALGSVHLFSENMTAGRGIIAFAAVILGAGVPLFVGLASALFGFAQALAGVLQIGGTFPTQFVLMVPYVFAILALAVGGRRGWVRLLARRRAGASSAAEEQNAAGAAQLPVGAVPAGEDR